MVLLAQRTAWQVAREEREALYAEWVVAEKARREEKARRRAEERAAADAERAGKDKKRHKEKKERRDRGDADDKGKDKKLRSSKRCAPRATWHAGLAASVGGASAQVCPPRVHTAVRPQSGVRCPYP